MSRIRKKNTKPELRVRRLAHSLGYRFRLHRRDLPGTPDLIFPARRKAIFVHGCFWHRHDCRLGGRPPATRPEYWLPKLTRNVERDKAAQIELQRLAWDVLVIWECEVRNEAALRNRLTSFLDPKTGSTSPPKLVHHGAKRCIMASESNQKRFTVSVDQADYDALRQIAAAHKPKLSLQYVLRVAIKNLLDQHAAKQLSFPLDR